MQPDESCHWQILILLGKNTPDPLSESCFRQALSGAEESCGALSAEAATCLFELSEYLESRGDIAEAQFYSRRYIEILISLAKNIGLEWFNGFTCQHEPIELWAWMASLLSQYWCNDFIRSENGFSFATEISLDRVLPQFGRIGQNGYIAVAKTVRNRCLWTKHW